MSRTITVKGVGNVSAKVDYVKLKLTIHGKDKKYDAAMEEAASQINCLECAVEQIGFKKGDLKTLNFDVRTEQKDIRDEDGNFHRVFIGYVCDYTLELSFDFESERLAAILSAIADSGANPELNITFTVKDPSKISEELLIRAAANAREKAEILCRASGTELGDLLSIDYNWGELRVESRTRYGYDTLECITAKRSSMPALRPDDIDLRDTAVFVWEIK